MPAIATLSFCAVPWTRAFWPHTVLIAVVCETARLEALWFGELSCEFSSNGPALTLWRCDLLPFSANDRPQQVCTDRRLCP